MWECLPRSAEGPLPVTEPPQLTRMYGHVVPLKLKSSASPVTNGRENVTDVRPFVTLPAITLTSCEASTIGCEYDVMCLQ
ncbi:hypothetical protein DPMN_105331 [Dreissena polymorpha]|uniref:Uncharacterized protein n=1 Tax=Dreissena polymorpha TaxID=45954 RepID=A0A9D4K0U5_DREPO|nr:hypothetical protein DPMN_105331 [Dreissena polymorpha]